MTAIEISVDIPEVWQRKQRAVFHHPYVRQLEAGGHKFTPLRRMIDDGSLAPVGQPVASS